MKARKSVLEHSTVFPSPLVEKKSNQQTFVQYINEKLRNFCDETNLHSFSYITWKSSTLIERRIWFIIVILAMIVSVILLLSAKSVNDDYPTVTVIESLQYPSRYIPFPAITICNFNRISKAKANALATKLKRPKNVTISNGNLTNLFLKIITFNRMVNIISADYNELNQMLKYNNMTVQNLRDQIRPNCNEMFEKCLWRSIPTGCELLFQKINTTEGVCCSFNYFGVNNTNYPIKVAQQFPKIPRRVTGWSYQSGLTVLLDPQTNDSFGSYFGIYGFQILIHDSYDYPDENADLKIVKSSTINLFKIDTESTYATSEVKDLHPNVRKCYFSDENSLQVMEKYSFRNCLAECKTRLFLEKCKCVPFNFPNNGRAQLCEFDKNDCIVQNKKKFANVFVRINETTAKNLCNCMPGCERNQYITEITSGKLNRKYSRDTFFNNVKERDQILLHVFYRDVTSTRFRRDVYQTWVTSLAIYGGILALIMGFSIVTAVEFVYYLIIGPFINHFKF